MPKRRRNRRKRRNYLHKNIVSPRTSQEFNQSQSKEILNAESPIRTLTDSRSHSLTHDKTGNTDNSLINYTTPKNKSKYNELNATNLNILFNDDEIPQIMNNGTPKILSGVENSVSSNLLPHHSRTMREIFTTSKERSCSSMAKLLSPGVEKMPISVDISTQTVYYSHSAEKNNSDTDESVHLYDYINIFETPKINQDELLDAECFHGSPLITTANVSFNKISDLNKLGNSDPVQRVFSCSKKLRSSSLRRLQNFNEILFSYDQSSPKVIQNDLKNNLSEGEISFFCPQLFELESASTPIEHIEKNEELYKPIVTERNLNSGCDYFTPKIKNTNSKYNGKIWSHRAINRQHNCITRRVYKSVSPKNFAFSKYEDMKLLRKKEMIVPKTFSPIRRTSTDRSENILNVTKANIYGRFIARVKKFHTRYSSKWAEKVAGICNWLGLTLKKSLSSLCTRVVVPLPIENKTEIDGSQAVNENKAKCECNKYKMQITELTAKLNSLGEEIVYINNENKEKINSLMQEMSRMQQELLQFETLTKRITDIEDHLKTKSLPSASPTVIPPAPPPPPPPLPPLPSIPLTSISKRPTKLKAEYGNKTHSRPIISVEDILKVKLRKTDKPPLNKRTTHPIISTEILNQVKLRPASRSQPPSSVKNVSSMSSSASTSPATSLTKLLSNVDTNVRRVKRLRRYSAYNSDDSRRRRERNDLDNT